MPADIRTRLAGSLDGGSELVYLGDERYGILEILGQHDDIMGLKHDYNLRYGEKPKKAIRIKDVQAAALVIGMCDEDGIVSHDDVSCAMKQRETGGGKTPTVGSIREGWHTQEELRVMIAEGPKEIRNIRRRMAAANVALEVGAYRGGRFAAPVDRRDCQ